MKSSAVLIGRVITKWFTILGEVRSEVSKTVALYLQMVGFKLYETLVRRIPWASV